MFRNDVFSRLAGALQPVSRSSRLHHQFSARLSSNQNNPSDDVGDSKHGSKSDTGARKTEDSRAKAEKCAQSQPMAVLSQPPGELILETAEWLFGYLWQQRESYDSVAGPLGENHKALLWPYFSAGLLNEIRFVELHAARMATPGFLLELRAKGFSPPDISHMESLTFGDVIVFNEELAERPLFHALVRAAQIRILGLQRYAQLWADGFVKTKAHVTVPLEVQAFSLTAKFPAEKFCVEDYVLQWVINDQY
jgi:hypothetical protein